MGGHKQFVGGGGSRKGKEKERKGEKRKGEKKEKKKGKKRKGKEGEEGKKKKEGKTQQVFLRPMTLRQTEFIEPKLQEVGFLLFWFISRLGPM